MDEPRTVIVAMDGSKYAKEAFEWYCKNLMLKDDKVIMVYNEEVMNTIFASQWVNLPYRVDREAIEKIIANTAENIKQRLEEYAALMKQSGVKGSVRSLHCNTPGEGILKVVEETNANLVVIGSRGQSTVRRTLLGSVSDYVVHHCHVPVAVCRHHKVDQ